MDIKEIAKKLAPDYWKRDQWNIEYFDSVGFAEALIESYKAELLKGVWEPVLTLFQHEDTGRETTIQPHAASDFAKMNKRWFNCGDLYSARQLAAAVLKAIKPLEDQLAAAREEVERLKGIKNVQLDIYPNDAGTKQQREVDGSLEMGQLLADSKNEETSNPKAERAKSLVWMHTGGGHIADSSGKRIGIFSGDFKHRDRLICAVNSESDLLAQLAAAQEENGRLENQVLARDAELWGRTQEILGLKDQLSKAEQLWQVAQGRCDGLEEKLAKAEQRVSEAIIKFVEVQRNDIPATGIEFANAIRSGEQRKFVNEV